MHREESSGRPNDRVRALVVDEAHRRIRAARARYSLCGSLFYHGLSSYTFINLSNNLSGFDKGIV